ncbi:MAG: MFS transporter [Rhodoferax sp.]
MLEPHRTHWPRIVCLWLCGVVAAMQFAKISLAFTAVQQWYGLSAGQMGVILSTVGLTGLVFGVTMGLYAHAIGYRRLLLTGLALGAVLAALQALMLPPVWLWVTRLLEGVSHLAVVVTAPTLIAAQCVARQRSVAMGLWSTFVGVAFALTGAFGPGGLSALGLDGFLGLHALAMLLMLGWAAAVVPADREAFGVRAWPRWQAVPRHHLQIYTRWETALPGLCFFCYTGMAVALLTFLPLQAGARTPWLAVVLPLMGIAGTFSAGWLAHTWVTPLWLVRLAFAGVGLAGVGLWVCALVGWDKAPAALLLMYLAGLSGGAAFSLIPYLSHESLVQSRANGAVAQMGNLGATLGPPLFAALLAAWGVAGLTVPVVALALLGIAVASWGARQRARALHALHPSS